MEKTDNEIIAELGYSMDETGAVLSKKGLPLRLAVGTGGYVQFNAYQDGKRFKTFLVHRLVAEKYIPNPNNLPEVNHEDGNKLNNHKNNLKWCTRSENIKHGIDTGLIPKSMVGRVGGKHWHSKTVVQYHIFGGVVGTYESTGEAASDTGFNRKSIQDACKGRLKTYKGFTWKYK